MKIFSEVYHKNMNMWLMLLRKLKISLSSQYIYELMGSFEAHEQRMSRYTSQSLEQAFQTKTNLLDKNASRAVQQQRGGLFPREEGLFQRRGSFGRGRRRQNQGRRRGRGQFQ